jgi:hypothetical protein
VDGIGPGRRRGQDCDGTYPTGIDQLREEFVWRPLTPHTLQPETSRLICRIPARKLISIGRQPVLIAASRCYLIQMLRSALTCTNGCSCWSPNEENSPQVFLTMDALYRLS